MSQKISRLIYQIHLTNSLELKETFFSPIFCTNNNLFWKLCVKPTVDEEYYGLYIFPVAGPDEINWGERSKLSIKLYAKKTSSQQTHNLYIGNAFHVPPDTKIRSGYGCPDAFEKSSLGNGVLLIGATFENFENFEDRDNEQFNNISFDSPPKDLIAAWKSHLFNFQPADVEFQVQNERFYACSSILSKRSEYFANLLTGQWAESTQYSDGEDDLSIKTENQNYQMKHRIEISDYAPNIFASMLEYIYTNKVKWTSEDDESNSVGLFCLADKYLLFDLRHRAKFRIINELNISNVSEIMFGLVPKYEDLKEPVLKFMAKNFEQASSTPGFKNILARSADYPEFDKTMSDLLDEYFKINGRNISKTNQS